MKKNVCFNSNLRLFYLNCFLGIKINLYSDSFNDIFFWPLLWKVEIQIVTLPSLYPWASDLILLSISKGDGQEGSFCSDAIKVEAKGSHFMIIRNEDFPRKRNSEGKSFEPVWLKDWATGSSERQAGTEWGIGWFYSLCKGSPWQGFMHWSDMF